MPNRYKQLVEAEHKKSKQDQLESDALKKKRLVQSTDYRGSKLDQLFSSDDIKKLREFLEVMAEYNYAGSELIYLKARRTRRVLNHLDQLSEPISKIRKTANKPLWHTLWRGKGYLVGVIHSKKLMQPYYNDCTEVYLCTDARLRCRRKPPVFKVGASKANGFGSIPDPKDLLPNLIFEPGVFNMDNAKNFRSFSAKDIGTVLSDIVKDHII
jgi:hypothetical protein